MKNFLRHTMVVMALLFTGVLALHGQSGFYIPSKGKIFFTGDTATIFSDVKNSGQVGVGKNATVKFKGKKWENDADALITDESNNGDGTTGIGGIIEFLIPDETLLTSVIQQQRITGGYNAATRTGSSFGNIDISNRWGVLLSGSSTKIRRELRFSNGHLFLNDNVLSIGNGNPGLITGYNENRFIVTGPMAYGGLLMREKISSADGYVSFPVGTSDKRYAPAALRLNSGSPDDFIVGVFDGVKSQVTSGSDLSDIGVNKTWTVGKLGRPGQDQVDLILQHRTNEEGNTFRLNRSSSYISEYLNTAWDKWASTGAPQAGSLTTGLPSATGGTNARSLAGTIGLNSYFSKFVDLVKDTVTNKTFILLRANRISDREVNLYWTTFPEVNIKYFVVQRMYSNETGFTDVGQYASKASGPGVSPHLDYEITDPNAYRGITYYRIKLVDYNGNITYSNIVPVGPQPGGFGLTLWPNPARSAFFVGITGAAPVQTIIIWNVLGQKIHEEQVNGRNVIPMFIYKSGAYFVSYLSFGGQIIETKKLLIVGY
jgi:hypothetical protein